MISKRPVRSRQPKTSRPWWSWGIALSLLGVLLTLAAWLWPRSPEGPPPPSRPAMYAVRVQVLDPQGQPVAGSTIRASAGNEPQRTPDGWWEVEIPAAKVPVGGRITLWAEHPEWGGNRKDLRLGVDQNVQVEIRLKKPESWLRGVVVDESGGRLAGVSVSTQEGPPGDAVTGPQGRFALKLPVPRETHIRLHAEHERLVGENFCFTGRDTCSITLRKP